MGLIKEGKEVVVLTDILGDEDHYGDMDFKVAGTKKGITAIQMDIKLKSLDFETITKALDKALKARLFLLETMLPYSELNSLPKGIAKIETISIPTNKIGLVIGSKGATIKNITEKTSCQININDDGKISIASENSDHIILAKKMILDLIR